MLEKGLIQVYTGQSDQMNFAPIGLSLRAAGQGLRTLITCFSPHELMIGAKMAASFLKPNLVIDYSAIEETPLNGKENDGTSEKITKAFQRAKKALSSGNFDIVILNGINQLEKNLLPIDDVLTLMEEKPEDVELVLSGPKASQEVLEKADLVTEMVVNKQENPSWRGNCPVGRGNIEVVTGEGKGKTTYCLGKGLLTSCIGIPALIFQFIKSPKLYGEVKAINRIPNLEIKTMGRGFLIKHSPYLIDKHRKAARQAWELWLKYIFSQDYGLLVMDEINIATHHGLINAERVMEMLVMKPYKFHILLSGRNAHPDIIKASTTTIEMKEIKHPYKKGIKARRGIEF
jgi:cob(I)alamin adenosyltransferase